MTANLVDNLTMTLLFSLAPPRKSFNFFPRAISFDENQSVAWARSTISFEAWVPEDEEAFECHDISHNDCLHNDILKPQVARTIINKGDSLLLSKWSCSRQQLMALNFDEMSSCELSAVAKWLCILRTLIDQNKSAHYENVFLLVVYQLGNKTFKNYTLETLRGRQVTA